MIQAKMTSKGQVTIPKTYRDSLNLHAGDHLNFILTRDGRLIVTTKSIGIDEIFGMFNYKKKKKTTMKDIDEAIVKRMRRKFK